MASLTPFLKKKKILLSVTVDSILDATFESQFLKCNDLRFYFYYICEIKLFLEL